MLSFSLLTLKSQPPPYGPLLDSGLLYGPPVHCFTCWRTSPHHGHHAKDLANYSSYFSPLASAIPPFYSKEVCLVILQTASTLFPLDFLFGLFHPAPHLIFVTDPTDISDYLWRKIVLWRNFRFLCLTDEEKSGISPHVE